MATPVEAGEQFGALPRYCVLGRVSGADVLNACSQGVFSAAKFSVWFESQVGCWLGGDDSAFSTMFPTASLVQGVGEEVFRVDVDWDRTSGFKANAFRLHEQLSPSSVIVFHL